MMVTTGAESSYLDLLTKTLPQLVLFAATSFILLLGASIREKKGLVSFLISVCGIAVAFFLSWKLWLQGESSSIFMLSLDRFTFLGWMATLAALLFSLLLSYSYLSDRKMIRCEYFALLLMSVIGMGAMIAAADLITFFVGLETMSIAVYVLAGYFRIRVESNEAALKYFINGAFASAFMVMGIAFIYGSAGTLDLQTLSHMAQPILLGGHKLYFLLGIALLLIGFGFKVSAVPFQFWAPDVYEGSPTPVTAFMAMAVKVAAFFAFVRIASTLLIQAGHLYVQVMWLAAVATMFVGNLGAIAQDNLKRLLAYSSIAHVGYLLVAFPLLRGHYADITPAILFYLVSYLFMTAGAFAVVCIAQGKSESADIYHLAGFARKRPALAAVAVVFFLSLAGFPPTLGFFAKYYLFSKTLSAGFVWLVVVALLNSAMSAYYYLRPIVVMYFHEAKDSEADKVPIHPFVLVVLAICLFALLVCGVFPNTLLSLTGASI